MIPRRLSAAVPAALADTPAVYVAGPRQAGKSTLVMRLARKDWPADYVTFDEAGMLGAAEANPQSFLRAWDGPLVLDEAQMAPDLFRALKLLIDEARHDQPASANGRYLLTGSSSILALPKLADALVGRMRVFTLYPLSALEVSAGSGDFLPRLWENRFTPGPVRSEYQLAEMIVRASFPEISGKGQSARRKWFEDYVSTILQRDVRQIAEIAKLGTLPNLLKLLAGRTGGLVNEADIARSLGLNAVTAKNYRMLLQMVFLTLEVRPWFRNIGKRLVKAPKCYLVDTSLLCHLRNIDPGQAAVRDPHVFGQIMENFVASELAKQLAATAPQAGLHHFRTSYGKEADFVLEAPGGKISAIEVKGRDAVTAADFNGLRELRGLAGEDFVCGVVLYRGGNIIPFDTNLWAVPAAALWR